MMKFPDHHEYCTGGFHPDDVVISGMAGRFPKCENVGELKEALFSKKDLLEPNNDRFEKGAADLPFSSCGTISNLDKLDAAFFSMTSLNAHLTEPLQRKLLEVSYEAILDAGYDPQYELYGAKVGVYSAVTNEDAKMMSSNEQWKSGGLGGYLRCMSANRSSYTFDFHGPSFTVDSACSSSLVALWSAVQDLQNGTVTAALVTGGQLTLSPLTTYMYCKTGLASPTSRCHPFDSRADGIVRTEAVTAVFLQKASAARRVYATVMDIEHIANGYVKEGMYVPSTKRENALFCDIMKKCGLTHGDIEYMECHGTGTSVGDPIEVNAIEGVYCKDREKPLYIGSAKGVLGHSEAAAGLSGTIKVIISFESDKLPPNPYYESPNPNCKALVEGRIQVSKEEMPITSPYIPVNSFGFGGSIVQALLKQNPVKYSNDPQQQSIPRLVLYAATTEEAIHSLFEYISEHPDLKNEFFALLNKLYFAPTLLKPYRGYALVQNEDKVVNTKYLLSQEKREVWFVMTGMGCQWPGMGLDMMKFDIFAESMKKSAAVLKPLGIDLFELLKKDEKHLLTNRNILPAFVSIAAIQIALVDMLRALDIQPDGIIGHSTGEMMCAYADGCCDAEQTILSAYWRGRSVEIAESKLIAGEMAAVGLTWDEAKQRCPEGVYPACHNADDSVTISGPKELVEKFVAELQSDNVFARIVNAYGYAFHSKYVTPVSEPLMKALSEVFPDPKPRSERWISTSYPEEEWENEACKFAGAEYFVHNLMSPVNFSNMLKRIPSNAITIEIGPHFLLQSLLKRSLGSEASFIGLMKRNIENNVEFFLESLGKLYNEGLNPKIEILYPAVKFPVPRGTPQISDLIKWDYSQSWFVPKWKPSTSSYSHRFEIDTADKYLLDHAIDGKNLFPATGYIFLAWQALSKRMQKKPEEINVIVEDFKIHRASIINQRLVLFHITIFEGTGSFEIMENDSLLASGKIYEVKDVTFSEPSPIVSEIPENSLPGEEIYNELRILGYEYGPGFRKVVEMSLDGTTGFVEWNNWITFLDSMLIFYINSTDRLSFALPTGALNFKICPSILTESIEDCRSKNLPGIPVNFHKDTMICRSPGVEIQRLQVNPVSLHVKSDECMFEEYKFVPYVHKYNSVDEDENLQKYVIACNKMIEIIEDRLKVDFSREKFPVSNKIELDVENYMNEIKDEYKLLSTLKQIADAKDGNEEMQSKEGIFASFVQEMGKDALNTSLLNEYCLRIMFDIITENSFRKLSVLELNDSFVPVLPAVIEASENKSIMKFKSKILLSKNEDPAFKDEMNNRNVQLYSYDTLATMTQNKSYRVAIGAFSTGIENEAQELLHLLASSVEQGGFILLFHKNSILPAENLIASLSDETINIVPQNVIEKLFEAENLLIISKISNSMGGIVYLLRSIPTIEPPRVINIVENEKWLDELKSTILDSSSDTVWVIGEECPNSGMIGMINCLHYEPGGDRIRCVFLPEKSNNNMPPFSFDHPFFKEVQKRDLVMNVHKDGVWGSFRHIEIEQECEAVDVDYSCLNMKRIGDLSSFQWYESSVKYSNKSDDTLVHIYYSALNFKDVMVASGKIPVSAPKEVAGCDNNPLGLEFSGRNIKGERIAGMTFSRGIANAIHSIPEVSFLIPENWSLEEAVTVPVVYITCYYALIIRGRLQPGESILIHSGTGGIGLAAINIALSMNCEIFTTVGTDEKREYLLKTFPAIKPENIGCSRNITFEDMIMKRTNGKGVDVVLNSLADEKFYASIRCVAKHGRFIELGKYDLSLDHTIGTKFFLGNIQFHGVFLDELLLDSKSKTKCVVEEILRLMLKGIKDGVVKPLNRTVFHRTEAEKAFRYMASGAHIGKVLLKIRDEEDVKFTVPKLLRLPAIPVTYFYPHKVYIVIGGLGGFGIEVSKWLLSKGAQNLILTSRYGARTPYHYLCLKRWKYEGYNVTVSTRNVSIKDEAKELLTEAAKIGPVGGIFNSAVVLHDAFLENMNIESFKEVCAPKADATEYLDILSRCLCPELDHFVCFSSISCGRGNAGQMNYGYANSVMERICEQRRAQGLPGVTIQWGIIGEVGVVHRHMGDDAMISGVGAQRVHSCLRILDVACQKKKPVVCSYVMKDLRKRGNIGDPLQQIAKILGLKDVSELNTVRNFGEMGVDSLAGIEIKNLLETACETTFTMKEIQDMKVEDVKKLLEEVEAKKKGQSPNAALVSTTNVRLPKSFLHSDAVQPLNEIKEGIPVFIIDIDCTDLTQLSLLGNSLSHPVFAVLSSRESQASSLESLASWYLQKIEEVAYNGISKKDAHIIAHSSASILAFEIGLQYQNTEKNIKTFTILNGSSYLMKTVSKETEKKATETDILCDFVVQYIPVSRQKLKEQLTQCVSLDQQTRTVVNMFVKSSAQPFDKAELSETITSSVKKIQQLQDYSPQEKLSKDLLIIEDSSELLANDVAEVKTQLSEICAGKVNVQRIPDITSFTDESVPKIISILESVF